MIVNKCDDFWDGISGVSDSLFAGGVVGFAGSRNLCLDRSFCKKVIDFFYRLDCSFAIGCCRGVDHSFLQVIADSGDYDLIERSAFFQAFESRDSLGLPIRFTSPVSVPPKAALAMRTTALVQFCDFLVVFSPAPLGKGSSLALRVSDKYHVPAMVVYCGGEYELH